MAFDLGETQLVTAVFDDGQILLLAGRHLKGTRRYRHKIRAKIKPPEPKQPMSRRFAQIAHQINHWLHILSKALVKRCYKTGVNDQVDYGDKLNQRLHAWPFAKLTENIAYKVAQYGIIVKKIDKAYTSQTCDASGVVNKSNRKARGDYQCACYRPVALTGTYKLPTLPNRRKTVMSNRATFV